MISRTASFVSQCDMSTILDPAKNARRSQDRQPVTWNRGIESRTVFCGSVGWGRSGIGTPARNAARDGAGGQEALPRGTYCLPTRPDQRLVKAIRCVLRTALGAPLVLPLVWLDRKACTAHPDEKKITASLSGYSSSKPVPAFTLSMASRVGLGSFSRDWLLVRDRLSGKMILQDKQIDISPPLPLQDPR